MAARARQTAPRADSARRTGVQYVLGENVVDVLGPHARGFLRAGRFVRSSLAGGMHARELLLLTTNANPACMKNTSTVACGRV